MYGDERFTGSQEITSEHERRASDPRFGDIIANGQQFKIKDLDLRNAQQYGPGLLMHRWREIEKDRRKNDRVARETAIKALRHRPLEIVGLAV